MKLLNFFRNLFSEQEEQTSQSEFTSKKVSIPVKRKRLDGVNTKHFKVRQHLIEKGTIDSWTAIELYGATRLSAIIFRLRKEGMPIESIPCTSYDRNSELCNYTTYKLAQENENN